MKNLERSSGSNRSTLVKCREEFKRFRQLAKSQGKIFPEEDPAYLASQTQPSLESLLERAQNYNQILTSAIANCDKGSLSDKRIVWECFKLFKVKASSDYMLEIDDEDYVEMVDQDGVQIMSSWKFMMLLNHSPEKLWNEPFHELFERDPFFMAQIQREFINCWGAKRPFKPSITPHDVWEINVPKPSVCTVNMKKFAVFPSQVTRGSVLVVTSDITDITPEA